MITRKVALILSGLSIPVVLGGCSVYPATEAEFGDSVRHMVRTQQIYTGAVNTTPVEQGDGQRLENVLEAYRTDVSAPEDVQEPLIINVGAQ